MDMSFLVTGHGRSGTKWLSRLLNQDPSVSVHHEPLAQADRAAYAKIYYGKMRADEYLMARKIGMTTIWNRASSKGFAEVNSYMRYCANEYRLVFNVPVAAIVRDGRCVVRSMMARGVYQKPGYPEILGHGMTPFEKCCWYWADTYRRLSNIETFRLEDLNSNYDEFCRLCYMLDVKVSARVWEKHRRTLVNADVGLRTPPYWGRKQKLAFDDVAGDIYYKFYGGIL